MLQELDASIKPVSAFIEHNRDTHKLVPCDPKEVDGVVYIMEAVALSEDELQAIMQSKVVKIKAEITQAVQQRLDAFAQTRNYDSILSACTYASSTVQQFAYEGQQCIDLRDTTWGALYDIMRGVELGNRPMPQSYTDIEAELPICEWQA
jgi:hypothetical protein